MQLEWLFFPGYLEHETDRWKAQVLTPDSIVTATITAAGYGEPEGFTPQLEIEPRGEGEPYAIHRGERVLDLDAAKADLEERVGWLLRAVGPRKEQG